MMQQPSQTRGRRAWMAAWVFFAGVMLAYSFVILLAKEPPPFVDFPDWVYQGVLFHAVLTGHPVAGYALKHYPVPNSLTTVGMGLLDGALPWQTAAKLWVVLYLALATFASWSLLRALRVRAWQVVVAMPAVLFVNLNFWYGHISFEIGVCLVMLLMAMLARGARTAGVAAMLVLIYFTHMEACGGALLLLVTWCAMDGQWRRLWAALPAVLLTAWYGAARFAGGNTDARGVPTADYRYGSAAFLVYKANTFLKVFGFVDAHALDGRSISEALLGRWALVAVLALSLVLAALCLWGTVRGALRGAGGSSAQVGRRAIAWFALVLLGASALLPQIWLGVADPGSRLVLLAALAGLLGMEWRGRSGFAIALLSALLCCVNLWQFACVEGDPRMAGRARDLPAAVLQYGHVEPATRLQYYDELERGEMDAPIFSTALFFNKTP